MTAILGISAYYHDSAAALVVDGRVVAAASEERFTRIKADPGFPHRAVEYCLAAGGLTLEQVDHVGFYEKPFIKFHRLLYTYLSTAPFCYPSYLRAMPLWIAEKLWQETELMEKLGGKQILYCEHHESHAASAFFPSPYEAAAILTVDGVGEWATATLGVGKGNSMELLAELRFPHSLGLLYSTFTYFTGFKVNSAEYKVMGLAPYGEPRFVDTILRELIDLKEDGSFRMRMSHFGYLTGLRMANRRFHKLFGGAPRRDEQELTQRDFDLARSIQVVTEEVVLRMARHLHQRTGQRNLVLAGGVALNCVANGKLLREGPFENIWIQPAAGDAGGSVGIALYLWHRYLGRERLADGLRDGMSGGYLGPEFSQAEIDTHLREQGLTPVHLADEVLFERVVDLLEAGKVVGWYQGRMEFGPRALGNRSILADPRPTEMRDRVNMKIKFRETFRPFAPSVLAEDQGAWFDLRSASPYMLLVGKVREDIPQPVAAITHIDGTARVQSVAREDNPRYHGLISAFKRRTGVPLVLNTSFNIRGEPVVCTPEDALLCFCQTWMDAVVLGDVLLLKEELPQGLRDLELRAEDLAKLPKD